MRRLAILACVMVAATPIVHAAEAPPGASACSGCHAPRGGASGGIPPIAAKSADEITATMLAYQAGEGEPTVMNRIAKGFTEPEIRAIAAWLVAGR
ncbi:hypothetical protein N825_16500 [Skermanella stibiiresistens SB22]|uniref:Cytochrome c domain-containing protein n=1 Tax=Skermanella stibiiresistens SB22 TaxID=1385369 RepID=W9GYJ5_9PROT|nr:c-type cytochrome [Skermanella stibiiresistens]EWY37651.1 hypothetical protein N825_16500 [Skermanella stibiiresistens SB22]